MARHIASTPSPDNKAQLDLPDNQLGLPENQLGLPSPDNQLGLPSPNTQVGWPAPDSQVGIEFRCEISVYTVVMIMTYLKLK